MKRYLFSITHNQTNDEYGEITIEASGYCTEDTPGTMYARNGDPGDPPEAGETEYNSVVVRGEDGKVLYDQRNRINPCDGYKIIDWDDLEEAARENAFR